MARVVIAAGGTGGHVYPALALAEELRERGHDIRFVGGRRIEARLVPEAGFTLHAVPMRGLPRSLSPKGVLAAVDLVRSYAGARRVFRLHGTQLVVGMGGYPSLAPSLAAPRSRVPVVLHEQNAVLSLAHRLSLRRARVLALSLPLTVEAKLARRVELVGNPIRPSICDLARCSAQVREERRTAARARFGLEPATPTLLVFGGSQGARALNESVPQAVGVWTARGALQVLHVTGPGFEERTRTEYEKQGGRSVIVPYVDQMEEAYVAADLAVTRSGASTVAELTALGLPAVLVPFPHAPGGAQTANATILEEAGAGRCVLQGTRDLPGRLRDALGPLVEDPDVRREVAGRALGLGRPDAAQRLADLVEETL